MTDTRGARAFIKTPLAVHTALVKAKMLVGGVPAGTIMYDSTNLFAIPVSAKAVASYVTGFPQSPAAWARFAGKLEIKIVQRNGYESLGDVLDVESGAATAADCPLFIAAHKKAGYGRPTIYTSVSNVPNVRVATGKYKLGVDYDLWVAGWTGKPHVGYPGAVATQYASFKSFDLSVIHDPDWPRRAAVVPPPPPPLPVLNPGDTGAAVKTLQTKLNAHDNGLTVDGVYGSLTLAAVVNFKLANNITDGIVGPVTWKALG